MAEQQLRRLQHEAFYSVFKCMCISEWNLPMMARARTQQRTRVQRAEPRPRDAAR